MEASNSSDHCLYVKKNLEKNLTEHCRCSEQGIVYISRDFTALYSVLIGAIFIVNFLI